MLYFRHKTDSDCYIFSLQADLAVHLIIISQRDFAENTACSSASDHNYYYNL